MEEATKEPEAPDLVARYVALFDGLSAAYDQSGVPFFRVIGRGLVDRLRPRPGERVLDIGAGRGAAAIPLAEAVGPDGRVDTVDLAPNMVRLLGEATAHLPQVHVGMGDARDPRPPAPPYDLISGSLVIFFLPDPVAAMSRWRPLLRLGGRVGVATFRPWYGAWQQISDLADEYVEIVPVTDVEDLYDTDAGVESILADAGFGEIRTEVAPYEIGFDDVAQWEAWTWATPMGSLWRRTPESAHPEILRRASEILESSRDRNGRPTLEITARYTFGVA